jgi:putative hydrolase
MKAWKKHEDLLSRGEWHIHTRYTDGNNDITDYCRRAEETGIPLVAFTEHVRRDLEYDFNEFLSDIDDARGKFDLIILSGCEAKVLPDGSLDVDEQILKVVDYPIFAFHSFPSDFELYVECLKGVLKNKYVNAWAHPGTLSSSHIDLPKDDLEEIFRLMKGRDVLLETNRKYDLPARHWIDLAKGYDVRAVRGSDVHRVEDME